MDADTLEPIVGAEVTVEHRVRHPMKTTNLGEYWKILLPGNYVLQVGGSFNKPYNAELLCMNHGDQRVYF